MQQSARLLFGRLFSIAKKLIIVAAVYILVLGAFYYITNKDKPKTPQVNVMELQREKMYETLNDPRYQSTPTGKQGILLFRVTLCRFVGEGCTTDPKEGSKYFADSIFGKMTDLIALPYSNPPASGVYWAYSGLQSIGIVPKSYAAEGIGFSSIRGFIPIWNLMRQISYLLIVLVVIFVGFMIMFRTKLNPQTVISVESALPRIVLALIYITFSFAIAGFLIDLMYVIMGVSIGAFTQLNIGDLRPDQLQGWENNFLAGSMLNLFPPSPKNLGTSIIDPRGTIFGLGQIFYRLIPGYVRIIIEPILSIVITGPLVGLMNHPVEKIAQAFNNAQVFGISWGNLPSIVSTITYLIIFVMVATFIPGWILGIIILLTVLFLVFRLFGLLFASYLKIILLIVFAPILLMLEAIPGRNAFSDWIKGLAGELITFPLVVIFLLTGYAIVIISSGSNYFILPFLGGLGDSNALGNLIGVGIILIIPDLIKLIKKSLGLKDLPISIGLPTFFGGAVALAGPQGALSSFGSLLHGLPPGVTSKLRTSMKNQGGVIGAVGKTLLGEDYLQQMYDINQKNASEAAKNPASSATSPGATGGTGKPGG